MECKDLYQNQIITRIKFKNELCCSFLSKHTRRIHKKSDLLCLFTVFLIGVHFGILDWVVLCLRRHWASLDFADIVLVGPLPVLWPPETNSSSHFQMSRGEEGLSFPVANYWSRFHIIMIANHNAVIKIFLYSIALSNV